MTRKCKNNYDAQSNLQTTTTPINHTRMHACMNKRTHTHTHLLYILVTVNNQLL